MKVTAPGELEIWTSTMHPLLATLWAFLLTIPHGIAFPRRQSSPSFDPADYADDAVITRDVCVIGGGSSGVYTAIRAKDSNKSVVVIEKKGRLGGHAATYPDPATGVKVDYGVVAWRDIEIVRNYFARLNVPLTQNNPGGASQIRDFRSGKEVQVTGNLPEGLAALTSQLVRYPYLAEGYFLPDPVPADLLLPFEDFVEKYPAITPAVRFLANVGQGLGDFLRQPTLYVFKWFDLDFLQRFQTGAIVTTARGDTSELYENAGKELGKDVLLNSLVIATQRKAGNPYAKVVVDTPTGPKLIQAKNLVIAIPPLPRNLRGFDLGKEEESLFKRFLTTGFYTSLVRNSGITTRITNAGADTPYNVPLFPAAYNVRPTRVADLVAITYGSADELPVAEVKANILADLQRLNEAGNFSDSITTPEFAAFANHSPFQLTVPPKDIAEGFYRELYSLQGKRRTYYTGGTFHSYDSSLLWNFTEAYVVPGITAWFFIWWFEIKYSFNPLLHLTRRWKGDIT